MKVTIYETLYMKNMVLLWSTIYETRYIMVLLWSTSVEKRIVALPLFWAFFFFFGLSLFLLGQCSIEWWSSHFYLFTTQWLRLDSKTKYDSIWMPPAVYRDMQWIKSDKYEEIMNDGFATNTYVNYMIMLSNMTMMNVSWWTRWWKVAWQYISEWLWKCHNR